MSKEQLQFEQRRDKNQKRVAISFSQKKENEIIFLESPTGSGKTRISILSALEKQKLIDSPIIISTNTNKNAKSIMETAKKEFGLSNAEVVLELGRTNYINISLLILELMKDKTLLPVTVEEIEKKYALPSDATELMNHRCDVLREDFVNEFSIDEEAFPLGAFIQNSSDVIGKKALMSIEEHLVTKKVIITNHAYFIVLCRFFGNMKNRSIDDKTRRLFLYTPVIFDEFHTLHDAAKTILTDTFSLFQLKNSIAGIANSSVISKTLEAKLQKILKEVDVIRSKIKDDASVAVALVGNLKSNINHRKGIDSIIRDLQKIDMRQTEESIEGYIYSAIKELKELENLNFSNNNTRVSFSPKKYPSFTLSNGVPAYKLKDELWMKLKGPIMGMSGTIRTENNLNESSYRWIKERSGLFSTNIKELQQWLDFKTDKDYVEKEQIIYKANRLNEMIENIELIKIDSLFDSSNFQYCILNVDNLRPPLHPKSSDSEETKDTYEQNKVKWFNSVSATLANLIKCNSLVLTMSFDEVEQIAMRLKEHRKDLSLCCAKNGKSMQSVIDEHMRNIENKIPSCIIGTEQYYTGLDLPGNALMELFLVKLPFKHILGEIGTKIYPGMSFSKTQSYENGVLFKTIQGSGRAIRDFKDKALFYILDPRILDKKRKNILDFLDTKGYRSPLLRILQKRAMFLKCENYCLGEYVYAFFSPIFATTPKDDIISLLKIDDIEKADRACRLMFSLDSDIEKYGKDVVVAEISNEKYNFWAHLLKILIKNNINSGGEDLQKKIIEKNLYGYANVAELSKAVFEKGAEADTVEYIFDKCLGL